MAFGNPGDATRRLPVLQRSSLAGIAALMALGILYFGSEIRTQLGDLAITKSDNVEWSLSQAEVEAIALSRAALIAARTPDASLDPVRLRFDLLSSRIRLLTRGPLLADLRADPEAARHLVQAGVFLDLFTPLVDGPDRLLRARLQRLSDQAELLRMDLRKVALRGIAHYSRQSDRQREVAAQTLSWLTLLTLALVALLGIMVLDLLRLNAANHQAAETERETRSRFQAILNTARDAILVTDSNGTLIGCNLAAENMFGRSRVDVLRCSLSHLIDPADPARLPGLMAGGGLVQGTARHADGRTFPVELSVSTAQSGGSGVHVAFVRDISERTAAETALRSARDAAVAGEQAKAELLAVMSHEIRTPLNGLLGTLDLMRREGLSPRMTNYATIMERSGKLLMHHVDDMLGIVQAEAGQLAITPEPVDLNLLIAELVESLAGHAAARGNRIRTGAPDPTLSEVWADPLRLRQVLLNLIGNALKFTENGSITVEAEPLDGPALVEVRVSDTGIGIATDDIYRVFDDFVTLDASYRRTNSGTGLGLGIARRMVCAMGGEIGVESEVGEGSLFWLRLPLAAPSDAVTQPVPDVAHGLKVLLVEDNQINRFVARDMLESDGHSVTEAVDGAAGVAAARREPFDLILMDISMPRVDGLRATREIRASVGPSRAAPILAITAHAQPDEVARFRDAGMTAVLHKPITRGVLREMIARTIGPSRAPGPEVRAARARRGPDLPLLDSRVDAELAAAIGGAAHAALRTAMTEEARCFFADPDRAVAQRAHRLAGSTAVLGLRALHWHLGEVERAAKDSPQALASTIDAARACWKRTRPCLFPAEDPPDPQPLS